MTQDSSEKYKGPDSGHICLLTFPQLTAFIFEANHWTKRKCQQENHIVLQKEEGEELLNFYAEQLLFILSHNIIKVRWELLILVQLSQIE